MHDVTISLRIEGRAAGVTTQRVSKRSSGESHPLANQNTGRRPTPNYGAVPFVLVPRSELLT